MPIEKADDSLKDFVNDTRKRTSSLTLDVYFENLIYLKTISSDFCLLKSNETERAWNSLLNSTYFR